MSSNPRKEKERLSEEALDRESEEIGKIFILQFKISLFIMSNIVEFFFIKQYSKSISSERSAYKPFVKCNQRHEKAAAATRSFSHIEFNSTIARGECAAGEFRKSTERTRGRDRQSRR